MSWLEKQKRQNPDLEAGTEEEILIQDIGSLFSAALKEQNLTKKELAERLGKDKASATRLLRGDRNLTLRMLAKIAYAFQMRVKIELVPLAEARDFEKISWNTRPHAKTQTKQILKEKVTATL